MKKTIIFTAIFILLLILTHIIVSLRFNGIDYIETFQTKYQIHDSTQTIVTKHFKILSPTNWVHVFNGYGEEGDACGTFLTEFGELKYEYGIFVNGCSEYNDSITVNRFKIYIGKCMENETIIYIPKQNEMERSLSFILCRACLEDFHAIINAINQLEFKKFYENNE